MAKFSKTTIMLLILLGIYIIFILSSDVSKIQGNLKNIQYSYFIFAIILWVASELVRIFRWHLFLKEIEDKVPFKANVFYYLAGFAFSLSPGRIGEVVRSPYLKRDYGIPISKTAPIVFVERFYDLLGMILVVSVGLIFIEFEKTVLIIPLALVFLIIVIFKNKKLLFGVLGKLAKIKFLKNIKTNFEESYNSVLKIIKTKFLVLGIATSTATYLLQAISIYFLILGLNSFILLEEIFLVFPVSQFAAALSFVPGGVGVFEGGMISLLVLFNLPYDVAITTTILIRLIGTGLFTAIGMICLKIISKEK